jgi:hypothetical protein
MRRGDYDTTVADAFIAVIADLLGFGRRAGGGVFAELGAGRGGVFS